MSRSVAITTWPIGLMSALCIAVRPIVLWMEHGSGAGVTWYVSETGATIVPMLQIMKGGSYAACAQSCNHV